MKIDAHQHFWNYQPTEYPWIQESWPIRKSFLPNDLTPLLDQCGLEKSIAVQARQTLQETEWLLQLADQSPRIAGVVGWVDLRSREVESQLARFAPHPKCCGVRHVVQDEPDDHFMLQPDFIRGISKLAQFGLTYDLLIFPRQLPAAIELVRQFPQQPFVLDHIAKPQIRDGTLQPWADQIRTLATFPNVCCKVSGMVTEASWTHWKSADLHPYLDVVFEAFGVSRLMYGSDWPVCLLASDYLRAFNAVSDYLAKQKLSPKEKDAFLGLNAADFYLGQKNG